MKRQSVRRQRHPRAPAAKAWPIALLAVLVLIYHGRMLFGSAAQMIATADIGYYFLWLHEYVRDHFFSGRLPLWNPYNFCGTPFAANPQASVFYPLSWLYLAMPVIQAHKLVVALHSLLAGSFMYLFVRSLGPGRIACMAASLPYAFGNYFMANAAVGHLTMLFTMSWLPLVLWLYVRALRNRHLVWPIWTGVALGVQILAGEPQNSYYTILVLVVYGFIHTTVDRSLSHWPYDPRRYVRWSLQLAMTGLVAGLMSAVQLLPTAEFAMHSDRGTVAYEFSTNVSAPPTAALAEFVVPWYTMMIWGIGAQRTGIQIQQNWEFAGYVGILTLVLAAGSMAVRGHSSLLALRMLLVLAVVLMLGRFTPLYHICYWLLPGLDLFRIPARAVIIVQWSLCVMAAFGFEYLFEAGPQRWRRRSWRTVAGIILSMMLIALIGGAVSGDLHSIVLSEGNLHADEVLTIGSPIVWRPVCALALALAMILSLSRLPRNVARVVMVLALAIDLFVARPKVSFVTYSANGDRSVKQLNEVRDTLITDATPYRIDMPPAMLIANAAQFSKLECVNGYAPMAIGRFYRFVHWMRGREVPKLAHHEIANSLYRSGEPFPLKVMNARIGAVWDGLEQRYRVVHNPQVLPRAWPVDRAEVIQDESSMLTRLRSPDFDPARTVLLERPPSITMQHGDGPTGSCVIRRTCSAGLDISCQLARDGYLVLSEVFYPGWTASVDGQQVELERANYVLSALPLSAGSHRIAYCYKPWSIRLGALVTILKAWSALTLGVVRWRSTRPR